MTEDGRQRTEGGEGGAAAPLRFVVDPSLQHRDGPSFVVRPSSPDVRRASSDYWVAAACGLFVTAMVGAAYAAVPLYTWFCRTTGFGGTPQIVTVAPGEISDRHLTVRFDANMGPGLPWRFEPER